MGGKLVGVSGRVGGKGGRAVSAPRNYLLMIAFSASAWRLQVPTTALITALVAQRLPTSACFSQQLRQLH